MMLPAVTLAFDNPDDIAHWNLDFVNFLDAKKFVSGKLFEVDSFFFMLDYQNYLRFEKEIKKRLRGKEAISHPPIVVFNVTGELYEHPCLHNHADMESEDAATLFKHWHSFAKACHHFDHDAD